MWSDISDDVCHLLQRTLDAHLNDTRFHGQLLRVCAEWMDADADATTLGMLPAHACEAAGGSRAQSIPLVATWQLLRLTAKTLDDVQDAAQPASAPAEINLATGMLMAAQAVLDKLSRNSRNELVCRIRGGLHDAMLTAAEGQHRDLALSNCSESVDPDTWHTVAAAKSGAPFGWAMWSGALLAGADEEAAAGYRSYGVHLGILLQVADDFNDVWNAAPQDDVVLEHHALPICYALFVTASSAERDALLSLLDRAGGGDLSAAVDIRDFLADIGAQSYLLLAARVQQQQARKALREVAADTPARRHLEMLPEQLFPALQPLNAPQP